MDSISLEEALDILNAKVLNNKTNNYIFTDVSSDIQNRLLGGIKKEVPVCLNALSEPNEFGLKDSLIVNVPIDLSLIAPKDILSYALEFVQITRKLTFTSKFDLLRCRGFLREYQRCLSLIFYNGNNITKAERMLLNEIYHFNSCFLIVSDIIKESNLSTYEIANGRMLDYREDYTRIRIRE